ncbi:hypothetical protein X994_2779 [Burkholderia pseudomallei]|nr:hypothetical protein X994_2779 [Burkholderia pseudomallei]
MCQGETLGPLDIIRSGTLDSDAPLLNTNVASGGGYGASALAKMKFKTARGSYRSGKWQIVKQSP